MLCIHFVMTKFFVTRAVIFIVNSVLEMRGSHPFQNNLSNFCLLRQHRTSVSFKEVI